MALIRRGWGLLQRAVRARLAAWRPGQIVAMDDRLWRCIAPEARLEHIAGGFRFTEGPVWLPQAENLDCAGHLYCTGPGGVWVLDPAGRQLGLIAIREKPSNCAWGDVDRCTLYITAQTSLYRLRVQIGGALAGDPHAG